MSRPAHHWPRWMLRAALVLTGVFCILCGALVVRERRTLELLSKPLETIPPTDVYAQWIELRPAARLSPEYIRRYLRLLDYQEITGTPSQPGQFSVDGHALEVYTRGFHYPDRAFPAQILKLECDRDGLSRLRVEGSETVDEWRLEPPLLARWRLASVSERPRARLADLPPYIPAAVVAVEDKRFFQHGAFDWIGIARALWVDLRQGSISQGGSTISQQLARSVFLDTRRTLRRKLLEAGLALYLEARYSKPQLLEMYLNQVYWGRDAGQALFGIEAASQSYFGKPARRLSVAEAALLAGLIQSPNRLSPRTAPDAARQRRNGVLQRMEEQKFLPPPVCTQAKAEPVQLARAVQKSNPAAYFVAMVRDTLEQRYSASAMASQGWRIFTTLDLVLQDQAVHDLRTRQGQASLVVLEPGTGAIRAWVGGMDPLTAPYDRVSTARRQPGSAFKPFVFLAALESRKATVATLLKDEPLILKGMDGDWSPKNYDRLYRGHVTAWESLVRSLNVPTVRLALETGLERVLHTAQRAGIESPLRVDLATVLGASETSLLELTNAYSTLASGGLRAIPYSIESIQALDGRVVEHHQATAQRAFEAGPALILTEMLRDVFDEGTASSARRAGFSWPAAGKTGTSENFVDAWFIGFTPSLACGIWVGYDRPQSLGRSAAGIALPIWTSFMDQALRMLPPTAFPEPEGLIRLTIDTQTGLRVRSGCPRRKEMYFLPGTEPTEYCQLHPGGLIGFFKRLTAPSTAAHKTHE